MEYIKKTLPVSLFKQGALLLGLGIMILGLTFILDYRRAMFDYLWIFLFLVSVGVGSLVLAATEYAAGATWSTPFRRIIEISSSIIPFLVILVIPLFFGLGDLFKWTHADVISSDPVIASKTSYLNVPFFAVRVVVCLAIWMLFYYFMTHYSEKQDQTGDPKLTKLNSRISVAFIPIYAITMSIAAIDWIMSLQPRWYSTIFGAYYFAGSFLAAIALNSYVSVKLYEGNYLVKGVNKDHFYSFGTMIFAFNIFWAYLGFSQYLLIWYADLPEETSRYILRWDGTWKYVSLALLFFHFVIPFLILVSRGAKTNLQLLKVMAIWMLAAHALDLYWMIMPSYFTGNAGFSWNELSFPLIVTGLIMIVYKLRGDRKNLVPVRDPKLQAGLDFHL